MPIPILAGIKSMLLALLFHTTFDTTNMPVMSKITNFSAIGGSLLACGRQATMAESTKWFDKLTILNKVEGLQMNFY